MQSLIGLFERTCGACSSQPEPRQSDEEFGYIFTLQPLSSTAQPEAVEATQRGVRLLGEGRIEHALNELHSAEKMAPTHYQVHCNLGCIYHERGDDEEALQWFREAHRLGPRNETPTLALALLEQQCGHLEESQWLLVNFLQEVNSSSVNVLRQLARLYEQRKNWSRAAGCYRRLVNADPSNDEWPTLLQYCLEQSAVDRRQSGGVPAVQGG